MRKNVSVRQAGRYRRKKIENSLLRDYEKINLLNVYFLNNVHKEHVIRKIVECVRANVL